MDPIVILRSFAEQVATHYAANFETLGAQTVKELAAVYNVSEATARHAMRLADDLLSARGLTLKVADSRSGWRIEPTNQERDFVLSLTGRLSAINSELVRYRAKAAQTEHRDPAFGNALVDAGIGIEMALQSLTELNA